MAEVFPEDINDHLDDENLSEDDEFEEVSFEWYEFCVGMKLRITSMVYVR